MDRTRHRRALLKAKPPATPFRGVVRRDMNNSRRLAATAHAHASSRFAEAQEHRPPAAAHSCRNDKNFMPERTEIKTFPDFGTL
jgi:hypothetical protein